MSSNLNYIGYDVKIEFKAISDFVYSNIINYNGIIFGKAVYEKILFNISPDTFFVSFNRSFDLDRMIMNLRNFKFDVECSNSIPTKHKNINKIYVSIKYNIGRSFLISGIPIVIILKVYNCTSHEKLEPPFNIISYFITDFFILDNYGIRLSKNTGTIIDNLDVYKKTVVTARIMNMIINRTTYIVHQNLHEQYKIVYKICDLLADKENKWKILNLPFDVVESNEETKNNICCICQDDYLTNNEIIYINNKDVCHKGCLVCYLSNEADQQKEEFRCPLRNPLNFHKIKHIDYEELISDIHP